MDIKSSSGEGSERNELEKKSPSYIMIRKIILVEVEIKVPSGEVADESEECIIAN